MFNVGVARKEVLLNRCNGLWKEEPFYCRNGSDDIYNDVTKQVYTLFAMSTVSNDRCRQTGLRSDPDGKCHMSNGAMYLCGDVLHDVCLDW